jgi:Ethanolamine utilization protein EutJ (predicted chaperonin)
MHLCVIFTFTVRFVEIQYKRSESSAAEHFRLIKPAEVKTALIVVSEIQGGSNMTGTICV